MKEVDQMEQQEEFLYLLVHGGEVIYTYWSEDEYPEPLLVEASLLANDIFLECSKGPPLKVNNYLRNELNLHAFKLRKGDAMELPLQEWVKEFNKRNKEDSRMKEEAQEKAFLELYKKYGSKVDKLRKRHPGIL